MQSAGRGDLDLAPVGAELMGFLVVAVVVEQLLLLPLPPHALI